MVVVVVMVVVVAAERSWCARLHETRMVCVCVCARVWGGQVILSEGRAMFFNFRSPGDAARFLRQLGGLRLAPPRPVARGDFPGFGVGVSAHDDDAVFGSRRTPRAREAPRGPVLGPVLVAKMAWTKLWVQRDLSTFDYLMLLNSAAGRTYNDLSQYPIFPWVLADYASPELDLGAPGTFRDLSRPIGALNDERLARFKERRVTLEDPSADVPPFLYGSHYSNVGTVLYYLVRMEPFTSYALMLQNGRFDHADRLFHDVAEAWFNCLVRARARAGVGACRAAAVGLAPCR